MTRPVGYSWERPSRQTGGGVGCARRGEAQHHNLHVPTGILTNKAHLHNSGGTGVWLTLSDSVGVSITELAQANSPRFGAGRPLLRPQPDLGLSSCWTESWCMAYPATHLCSFSPSWADGVWPGSYRLKAQVLVSLVCSGGRRSGLGCQMSW